MLFQVGFDDSYEASSIFSVIASCEMSEAKDQNVTWEPIRQLLFQLLSLIKNAEILKELQF